jgi:hypothetical protein
MGVARRIYKNHIKGDPPFKPQHGRFGQVSWFKGEGSPYIGGQAQQYDVTIDVSMPDPRRLRDDFFANTMGELENFNPKDATQHGNFWRHLGQRLEGEGLSEVHIPQGDLSKQGSGTFIAADRSVRSLVRLRDAAKLRNDIGAAAADQIDQAAPGQANRSPTFTVSLRSVSAATKPLAIQNSLNPFIAAPSAVKWDRAANPMGNSMADRIAGQTYTVTGTLTYANYLSARKNAKTLATAVADGKFPSIYGAVTVTGGANWPATATRSYTANYVPNE